MEHENMPERTSYPSLRRTTNTFSCHMSIEGVFSKMTIDGLMSLMADIRTQTKPVSLFARPSLHPIVLTPMQGKPAVNMNTLLRNHVSLASWRTSETMGARFKHRLRIRLLRTPCAYSFISQYAMGVVTPCRAREKPPHPAKQSKCVNISLKPEVFLIDYVVVQLVKELRLIYAAHPMQSICTESNS